MSNTSYAREKLSVGIEIMATSARTLQDRIRIATEAWGSLSDSHFEKAEHLVLWRKIHHALTVVRNAHEGYIPATLSAMSDEAAERIAEDIFELYETIELDSHLSD